MKTESVMNEILNSAKKEFMEFGFINASMRRIAESAGLTTGSLYNRFSSKDEMFAALVKEGADELYSFLKTRYDGFASNDNSSQIALIKNHMNGEYDAIIDIIFKHKDAFKLIICKSEGSQYFSYLDRLIDLETKGTKEFIDTIVDHEKNKVNIDIELVHILSSSLYKGIFEIVEHDMTKQEALSFERNLSTFFTAGWEALLLI